MAWLIGILLACASNLSTGMSILAIRKSWLMQNANHGTGSFPRRLRLVAYMVITAVVPALDVSSMAFAAPSLLAPFSGLSLASVVLFSKPVAGEQPEPIRVAAASLVILGDMTASFFGDHTSHNGNDGTTTLDDIRDSYLDPSFLCFLFVAFIFECTLIYTMITSENPYWKRFAWGVAGGFLTGFQNFMKDAIAVLQMVGGIKNLPWWFFGLLLMGAAVPLGGLNIMAECMRRYDATYSSGSFVGAMVLSAETMSVVHYHTFAHLNPHNGSKIWYPLGLTILMTGVGLLMHHSPTDDDNPIESISIPMELASEPLLPDDDNTAIETPLPTEEGTLQGSNDNTHLLSRIRTFLLSFPGRLDDDVLS